MFRQIFFRLFLLTIASITVSACDSSDPSGLAPDIPQATSVLPLSAGNAWTYDVIERDLVTMDTVRHGISRLRLAAPYVSDSGTWFPLQAEGLPVDLFRDTSFSLFRDGLWVTSFPGSYPMLRYPYPEESGYEQLISGPSGSATLRVVSSDAVLKINGEPRVATHYRFETVNLAFGSSTYVGDGLVVNHYIEPGVGFLYMEAITLTSDPDRPEVLIPERRFEFSLVEAQLIEE